MHQFTPQTQPRTFIDLSYRMALTAAAAADDRKGGEITLLDVTQVSTLADYFLIVTGYSTTQVRAIARVIQEEIADQWQRDPLRVEGMQASSWILVDYADLIVHVMLKDEREYYDLETFWGDAQRVEIPLAS